MLVRLLLSVAIALGLGAGAAQACQCRPVVHHVAPRPVVRHRVNCHCVVYHHARRGHTVIREVNIIEHRQAFSDDSAYRYAEQDRLRWRSDQALRVSPQHPWATDRAGYLIWSGKDQSFEAPPIDDRYANTWPEWNPDPGYAPPPGAGCPNTCPPPEARPYRP